MNDKIYRSYLESQWNQGKEMVADTHMANLVRLPGSTSNQFMAEFYCRGLALNKRQEVFEPQRWRFILWFPSDYLRSRVIPTQIISYVGPNPEPFHPNIRGPFVCLNILPGTELVELLYGLYDLLTYRVYAADDALNTAAAQYVRNQPVGRFPVDPRPFRWVDPGQPKPELAIKFRP